MDGTTKKAIFSIACTTCQARLAIFSETAIGQIFECPKCHSLVQITPPADWKPAVAPPPLGRVAAGATTVDLDLADPPQAGFFSRKKIQFIWFAVFLAMSLLVAALWQWLVPASGSKPTIKTPPIETKNPVKEPAAAAPVPKVTPVAPPAVSKTAGTASERLELRERGIKMSDGTVFRLPPPIMADRLDAAGQSAALGKAADARNPVQELVRKSYYAPVMVKVRTLKPAKGEGPAVRAVDVWFVAHGKWKTLLSKEFLDSTAMAENGKSQVVARSGFLSDEELRKRNLTAAVKDGREERFFYTTFSLFERVEISATRFSTLVRGDDSLLAAGKVDPRFDKDATYPNAWRPLMRDAQAEITRGPAQAFSHAAGYAKITRLQKPADAVFVESHIIYEEPYGWFDGVNLVKQKTPAMVQEKVRSFRRKLAVASEEKQAQ